MTDVVDPKQKLLLEFALSSKDLFINVAPILKPQYFSKPLDAVVKFTLEYFKEYHAIADRIVIHAETGVRLELHDISKDEMDYCIDELEDYCKKSAMRLAILDSADELASADEEEDSVVNYGRIEQIIRDAISVSLDKNLGLDMFVDPTSRLLKMLEEIDGRSFGYPSLDKITDNAKRGEIVLLAASSGGGKSVMLANFCNNFATQGLNVLYITLELNENLVAKRFDSIITGIDSRKIFDEIQAVAQLNQTMKSMYGSIFVKKMPTGCTTNDIRAYLMEYHLQFGFYPDMIAVDYMDIMSPNAANSRDGIFDRDKRIAEELRDLMIDFNIYGFTASQLNRDATNVEIVNHSHIAGGLSKINTSDVAFAILRNEEDRDNGIIRLQAMKLRNAELDTNPIVLNWNNRNLQITDPGTAKVKATSDSTITKIRNAASKGGGTVQERPRDRLKEILSKTR